MTRSLILGWPIVRLLCVTGLILTHVTGCEDALLGEPAPEPGPELAAPAAVDCDALCGACGDGDCRAICLALGDALDPAYVEPWAGCMAVDACDPDRARACIDGLGCHHEQLIARHCDILARCGMDGRGVLDDQHCRANPYHEASRWGCLKPDRIRAVSECLIAGACFDVPACLDNAICLGDGMCGALLSTALTVDCHRVCEASLFQCRFGGVAYGDCWRTCERAATHLADVNRRAFETCALDGRCRPPMQAEACIGELDCAPAPALTESVAGAAARCGQARVEALPVQDWSCLGEVHIQALAACLDLDDCAAIEPCLAEATTCADDPDCLSFLDARRP